MVRGSDFCVAVIFFHFVLAFLATSIIRLTDLGHFSFICMYVCLSIDSWFVVFFFYVSQFPEADLCN